MCALKGTHLSDERKKQHSEIIKLKHKEWRETDPEGYKLRQAHASKHSPKGLATYKKHPEIYKEFGRKLKEYMAKNPMQAKQWQSHGGKKSILKLKDWKKNNPKIAINISKQMGKLIGTKYSKESSDRLKKMHQELKEKDPEAYRLRQSKSGKLTTGWKTTIVRHPDHFSRMGKQSHLKHPEHCKEIGKKGGKKSILKLKEWRKENPQLWIAACKKGYKIMKEKYPNLITRKLSSEEARRMGKTTQQKHPEIAKKLGEWVRKHPEFVSQLAKETNKKYPNLASERGKMTHKKHPDLAKRLGKITQTKHPELLKTMGIRSAEVQAQRGFISKIEKQMKEWLPNDFVHGKRLGKFVPDFQSSQRKIIIEVDGDYWHSLPKIREKDNIKKEYFSNLGYKLYRFKESEIKKYPDAIKSKLKEILDSRILEK